MSLHTYWIRLPWQLAAWNSLCCKPSRRVREREALWRAIKLVQLLSGCREEGLMISNLTRTLQQQLCEMLKPLWVFSHFPRRHQDANNPISITAWARSFLLLYFLQHTHHSVCVSVFPRTTCRFSTHTHSPDIKVVNSPKSVKKTQVFTILAASEKSYGRWWLKK